MVKHDEMVALAQALQWCATQLRVHLGILCGAAQDLHMCLVPLMERGDLLSLPMLEVMEEKAMMTSPSSVEETRSPDEEPEPWEE